MQLSTYIRDLLYRYECVIIPGFGAFLTQYRSASIDVDSQTFYPPGKVLSFNRQLQTNDGLLANYVASAEGISYEEALKQVRNFTGTLSLQLEEGRGVSLEGIGELFFNEEKAIQFNPFETSNFSTSSFGLSSMVSPLITREELKEDAEKRETAILFDGNRSNSIPYLKYAAVALIAISLTGFAGMKVYEHQVREYNFAEKQKASSLVGHKIQEATFTIEDPLPAVNLTIAREQGKYHIVAGAFRMKENAEKKLQQLIAKGFEPRMIGQNKYGLHQVIYNSFEGRLDALRNLRDIQQNENPDAWLLVEDLSK